MDALKAASVLFGGDSATAAALRQAVGLHKAPPLKVAAAERRPMMVRYGLAVDMARRKLGPASGPSRNHRAARGAALERELVMGELEPRGVEALNRLASATMATQGVQGAVGGTAVGGGGGVSGGAEGVAPPRRPVPFTCRGVAVKAVAAAEDDPHRRHLLAAAAPRRPPLLSSRRSAWPPPAPTRRGRVQVLEESPRRHRRRQRRRRRRRRHGGDGGGDAPVPSNAAAVALTGPSRRA